MEERTGEGRVPMDSGTPQSRGEEFAACLPFPRAFEIAEEVGRQRSFSRDPEALRRGARLDSPIVAIIKSNRAPLRKASGSRLNDRCRKLDEPTPDFSAVSFAGRGQGGGKMLPNQSDSIDGVPEWSVQKIA